MHHSEFIELTLTSDFTHEKSISNSCNVFTLFFFSSIPVEKAIGKLACINTFMEMWGLVTELGMHVDWYNKNTMALDYCNTGVRTLKYIS